MFDPLRRLVARMRSARTPAEPVSLDLVQQLALRALDRWGPLPYARIAEEVTAVRSPTPAEIVNGLLRLETAGIIARNEDRELRPGDRRYVLTRRGRRFIRYIPADPRSALEFYI